MHAKTYTRMLPCHYIPITTRLANMQQVQDLKSAVNTAESPVRSHCRLCEQVKMHTSVSFSPSHLPIACCAQIHCSA